MLNESDKIVNDQNEVANHFNNFFSIVAENIGKYTVYDPSDHPSLIEIKKQNDCTNNFVFEKVTTDKVKKIINNINIKKATGADGGIPSAPVAFLMFVIFVVLLFYSVLKIRTKLNNNDSLDNFFQNICKNIEILN